MYAMAPDSQTANVRINWLAFSILSCRPADDAEAAVRYLCSRLVAAFCSSADVYSYCKCLALVKVGDSSRGLPADAISGAADSSFYMALFKSNTVGFAI